MIDTPALSKSVIVGMVVMVFCLILFIPFSRKAITKDEERKDSFIITAALVIASITAIFILFVFFKEGLEAVEAISGPHPD